MTGAHTTMAYARYVYGVNLWEKEHKFLPDDLEVDHINNDCTDDRIENLQLLTREENARKEALRRGRCIVLMQCPVCNKFFFRQHNASGLTRAPRHILSTCCSDHKKLLAKVREKFSPDMVERLEYENKILVAREFPDGRVMVERILNSEKTAYIYNLLGIM